MPKIIPVHTKAIIKAEMTKRGYKVTVKKKIHSIRKGVDIVEAGENRSNTFRSEHEEFSYQN